MTEAEQAQLARIESKLDTLIAALADDEGEEEDQPLPTLDGQLLGRERDQGMSLD